MTNYLAVTYSLLPPPVEWAEIIAHSLEAQNSDTVIDLCSGGGGPLPALQPLLPGVNFIRTDLHPREGVRKVDVLNMPADLHGVRTMFAAFHHFAPDDAVKILRNAADTGQSLCIFEATSRTPVAIVSFGPGSERFSGLMHATDVGKRMISIVRGE